MENKTSMVLNPYEGERQKHANVHVNEITTGFEHAMKEISKELRYRRWGNTQIRWSGKALRR